MTEVVLSYSDLKTFDRCPREWRHRKAGVERITPPTKYTLAGSAMARLARWCYEQRWYEDPDTAYFRLRELVPAALVEAMEKDKLVHHPSLDGAEERVLEALPVFVETIRRERLTAPVIHVERDLAVAGADFKGRPVRWMGQPDLVLEGEKTIVLDGKMGSTSGNAKQPVYYSLLLVEQGTPFDKLKPGLWSYRHGTVSWCKWSTPMAIRVWKWARELATRILDGEERPTPSYECVSCPYRAHCPEGLAFTTSRPVIDGVGQTAGIVGF